MASLIGHGIACLVLVGFGYWLHYRFGATVAKDASAIRSVFDK